MSRAETIACFLPSLYGGGAERVALNLLAGLQDSGVPVQLVVGRKEGAFAAELPQALPVHVLGVDRMRRAVAPLADFLARESPAALMSHMTHANLAALAARRRAGGSCRVVVVEHMNLDPAKSRLWREKLYPPLARRMYPRADEVVTVSKATAADLERRLRFEPGRVRVIYNPVVDDTLRQKAAEPCEHSWLAATEPVILGVGRLSKQKDFFTLLEALALVRRGLPARLIVLGEGEDRAGLERAARASSLQDVVQLAGFCENPFAFMHRADLFVLSSRWEALPTALIEAMACGCPVVSTDCPFGPREILEDGRWGPLVPVRDPRRLADAMIRVLREPPERESLRRRAEDFSVERAVREYRRILLP